MQSHCIDVDLPAWQLAMLGCALSDVRIPMVPFCLSYCIIIILWSSHWSSEFGHSQLIFVCWLLWHPLHVLSSSHDTNAPATIYHWVLLLMLPQLWLCIIGGLQWLQVCLQVMCWLMGYCLGHLPSICWSNHGLQPWFFLQRNSSDLWHPMIWDQWHQLIWQVDGKMQLLTLPSGVKNDLPLMMPTRYREAYYLSWMLDPESLPFDVMRKHIVPVLICPFLIMWNTVWTTNALGSSCIWFTWPL